MGDRRPTDSGGVDQHYKMCKKITSNESSKQIFLYFTMSTGMTSERKKRRITTGLPSNEGFMFIVYE
jgi:hypothetical protein